MLSKSILFALILPFCGTLGSTPFRKCANDYPTPLSLQLNDCEELPCTVIRGKVSIMDVQFVANKDVSYLESEVRARVLGITIVYPLEGDGNDVCKNLLYGAYCPLYATEDVTYHIDFPLDSSVPEVSLKCEVTIFDINKEVLSCFAVDLRVRKGS